MPELKLPVSGEETSTIGEIARRLADFSPEQWFRWPPDLFALTSYILKATGLYNTLLDGQVVPSGRKRASLRGTWKRMKRVRHPEVLNGHVDGWHRWMLESDEDSPLPPYLAKLCGVLFSDEARLTRVEQFDELTTWQARPVVIAALLEAHALADSACRGFGLMSSPRQNRAPIRFFANLYLVFGGTCSRLQSWNGVVLPRTRTPQKGLSTRSFSHHLTYHQSEVRVRWRGIPWVNQDNSENTAHILLVPAPYEVKPDAFNPVGNSDTFSNYLGFEYFEYNPSAPATGAEDVVEVLRRAYREVTTVHLIVFPELALTSPQLREIKDRLRSAFPDRQMPVLIAGIRQDDKQRQVNKVTLSAFFAGKWYDFGQHKHHRWRLDAQQIRQYSLEGVLNPQRLWWERIRLSPRVLTVVAPNNWLTICPLICEDLAQIEPVSELIRGIGPTLVSAVLMDGPQLKDRWSSRYVGVLADDPGTSILTLTSLGMARRAQDKDHKPSSAIALWKDQVSGPKTIELADDAAAVLMTVSAQWSEEFTADNRSDDSNASILVRQSDRQIEGSRVSDLARVASPPLLYASQQDTEEISVLTFLVDAVIDARMEHVRTICEAALARNGNASPPGVLYDVWDRTVSIIRQRYADEGWPRAEYAGAVEHTREFMEWASPRVSLAEAERTERDSTDEVLIEYWRELGQLAVYHFEPGTLTWKDRDRILAFELVLWALHNRFSKMKRDLLGKRSGPASPGVGTDSVEELYARCRNELRSLQTIINSTGNEAASDSVMEVRERWRREGERLARRGAARVPVLQIAPTGRA